MAIWFPRLSVNQMLPSEPSVMPSGTEFAVGIGYSRDLARRDVDRADLVPGPFREPDRVVRTGGDSERLRACIGKRDTR